MNSDEYLYEEIMLDRFWFCIVNKWDIRLERGVLWGKLSKIGIFFCEERSKLSDQAFTVALREISLPPSLFLNEVFQKLREQTEYNE
jgi:hypothetical protein